MSDGSAASDKPSLAARIDTEKSHPLAWKTVAKRAVSPASQRGAGSDLRKPVA